MSEILDSGARREFDTRAVRDIDEEKGRCDLLPLGIIDEFLIAYDRGEDHGRILSSINRFIYSGEVHCLYNAIVCFATRRYNIMDGSGQENYIIAVIEAILEASKHYKDGCKKYGERNWEKGIPLHCYIDSGVRHYLKYIRGDADEPHDRAFIWNMLGALWTLENKPELNDLPFAEKLSGT